MADSDRNVAVIDIGGTQLRAAVVNAEGRVLSRKSSPSQPKGGREVLLEQLKGLLTTVLAPYREQGVCGLGVAVPGPVEPKMGRIFHPPNFPSLADFSMREWCERTFALPTWVGNDANLAALGEHRFGAGRGYRNLVYLTISTGVGAGLILGGRLLLGAAGLAGEVGHMIVDRQGPPCNCGGRGCLEALVSGPALARRAQARLAAAESSLLQQWREESSGALDAPMVERAARSGDKLALEVFREAGEWLGVALLNLLHLLDPEVIILGGGVSRAGDLLLEPARRVMAAQAMPGFRGRAPLIPGSLGDDAGLLGAAVLVLQNQPS